MPDSQRSLVGRSTRPQEIVVDRDKAANLVHEHRRLTRALDSVRDLIDAAIQVQEDVAEALRQEPAFDAIPQTAAVDGSFADWLPPCVECKVEVPWIDALLVPCASTEDGEVEWIGVVHRDGCPAAARVQKDGAGT